MHEFFKIYESKEPFYNGTKNKYPTEFLLPGKFFVFPLKNIGGVRSSANHLRRKWKWTFEVYKNADGKTGTCRRIS